MSLLGFNGQNADTVWLSLEPGSVLAGELGTSPIAIVNGTATYNAGGIFFDVPAEDPDTTGPQRYWVPIAVVAKIEQKQPDPFQ